MGHLITDSSVEIRESAGVFSVSRRAFQEDSSEAAWRGHMPSQVIKEPPSTSIISLHGIAMRWGLGSVTLRWWWGGAPVVCCTHTPAVTLLGAQKQRELVFMNKADILDSPRTSVAPLCAVSLSKLICHQLFPP